MLMSCLFTCLLFMIFYSGRLVCKGSDTLLPGQSLFPNQTLISKGGKFEVGFFSPPNSDNYYMGIWYKNIPLETIVWVLNGYYPIPYSQYNDSRLLLSSSGNFELLYDAVSMIWESSKANISKAVILDNGNFVGRNGAGGILWQSFDYPTDTWLPGMKLHYYNSLVSWRNPYDPAPGDYSLAVARSSGELSVLVNYSNVLWTSGALTTSYNISSSDSGTGAYFIYNDDYTKSVVSRIVIDYLGRLIRFRWSEASQAWIVPFSTPKVLSSRPNTICNNDNSPACRCLDGFVPQLKQDRDLSNFSSVKGT